MFGLKYRFQDVSFTPEMKNLLLQLEEIKWFKDKEEVSNYTKFNLKVVSDIEILKDYFIKCNYSGGNSLTALYYEVNNQFGFELYTKDHQMRDNTWSRLEKEIEKEIDKSSLNIVSIKEQFIALNNINVDIRLELLVKSMFFEIYYQQYFPNITTFGLDVLPLLEKGYTIIGWDGFQKDEDIDTEDEFHGEDYKVSKADGTLVIW